MKKRVGIILLVVLLYLLIWYVGMLRQYLCWKIELCRLSDSWNVYVDEDGFNYSVALPYFAMYEGGNLALTYLDRHQQEVNVLLDKANAMWDLQIPQFG